VNIFVQVVTITACRFGPSLCGCEDRIGGKSLGYVIMPVFVFLSFPGSRFLLIHVVTFLIH